MLLDRPNTTQFASDAGLGLAAGADAAGISVHLLPAWQALSQVLSRSWRGSILCECVNSLLRPVLNARKSSDQGCLELFRFLHNTHRFARGKRAGRSPAELAGIQLPADPLSLLGWLLTVNSIRYGFEPCLFRLQERRDC